MIMDTSLHHTFHDANGIERRGPKIKISCNFFSSLYGNEHDRLGQLYVYHSSRSFPMGGDRLTFSVLSLHQTLDYIPLTCFSPAQFWLEFFFSPWAGTIKGLQRDRWAEGLIPLQTGVLGVIWSWISFTVTAFWLWLRPCAPVDVTGGLRLNLRYEAFVDIVYTCCSRLFGLWNFFF